MYQCFSELGYILQYYAFFKFEMLASRVWGSHIEQIQEKIRKSNIMSPVNWQYNQVIWTEILMIEL